MRTIVILLTALGSLAFAQGVLDRLKQKVDQLNKAGQTQQQKQGQHLASVGAEEQGDGIARGLHAT